MNANEIAAYIQGLERENQRLQKSVENLLTELEERANKPADSELLENMNNLIDLVIEEIEWQEEHYKNIPKGKKESMKRLIEAYRKVRPGGGTPCS